jgi:hypothetical protein
MLVNSGVVRDFGGGNTSSIAATCGEVSSHKKGGIEHAGREGGGVEGRGVTRAVCVYNP